MSTELEMCLIHLKGCIDSEQAPRARSLVARATELTVGSVNLSQAEAEYAVDCILNSSNGLIAFLKRTLSNPKRFSKANEDIFELLRKVIEKHSSVAGKSIENVISTALRYIQSSAVSARERELATMVVQDALAFRCITGESYRLDRLLEELVSVFDQRKLTNRFQQNLFELFGMLSKEFPNCVSMALQQRIRDALMNTAESQLLEENYPSLVSLAGAVRGMHLFFINFAPSEDDVEWRRRIYVLVKKLSDWDERLSERAVFRNSLELLATHGALFSQWLYLDHTYWQSLLTTKWLTSNSKDDRRIGLQALYTFHREVARVLEANLNEGVDREQQERVLNVFMTYYRKILRVSESTHSEVRLAIRGFGIMAGPCQRFAGDETINEMLLAVLERIECVCPHDQMSKQSTDTLEDLPDYVQALSEIMNHVRELSGARIISVQRMIVGLIRDFYRLASVHHHLIVQSLRRTFTNLAQLGGGVLASVLENVVLQGIIWTCSHSLPYDTYLMKPEEQKDWKEFVTYTNYLPLWRGLLSPQQHQEEGQIQVAKLVYQELMKSLFRIIEKLDLSTRKRTFKDAEGQEQELFFCDPNIDLEPRKPKDFHIFFNIVELYRELLLHPTNDAVLAMFDEWIVMYFDNFVKKSFQHPLVSGFVKLIELGLVTLERSGYFREQSVSKMATIKLLVYYLEQIIRKSLNATGELQLSCLRFVLRVPVGLLGSFIDDDQQQQLLIRVLRIALQLGHGLLTIANSALSCVQKIVAHDSSIPAEAREKLLQQVLPLLDPYLQTMDTLQPAFNARLVKFHRKKSVNVSASKIENIKRRHALESTDSELVRFQMRIIRFLGDLEPNVCTWLVRNAATEDAGGEEDSKRPLVRWDVDTGRSIELKLQCSVGMRPCIKLDNLVGRVCQLATSCSDRRTKMAACELLHTIILYVLGIQYQDHMTALWLELCKHLLQLSCDTDIAVCQMFEPLTFQIVHYLTQPSKLSQQGTAVFVDCLMQSISHANDSGIRDLAARCLREFILWTVRQSATTRSPRISSPADFGVVLERLKTYSLDSNPHRRHGAALAFNNIYRLLLQEDTHIERCWFELVHAYSVNFIMTEDFDSAEMGLEQISTVFGHLVRVLLLRKELFNRASPVRIVPQSFAGSQLKDLVQWLLAQCTVRQLHYRRKCMEVFPRLATAVDGVSNGREFVQRYFTIVQLVGICDHVGVLHGIGNSPNLNFIRDGNMMLASNIYLWLEYLFSSIDVYCWLIRSSSLSDPVAVLQQSNLFPAVDYFLRSVSASTMVDLMRLFNPTIVDDGDGSIELRINAEKIVKFNTLKSIIMAQIVELLNGILSSGLQQALPEKMWTDPVLPEFIIALLFEPTNVGLDFSFGQDMLLKLPKHIEELIGNVEHMAESQLFYRRLESKLETYLADLCNRISGLLTVEMIARDDQESIKGLLTVAKLYTGRMEKQFTEHTKQFLQSTTHNMLIALFHGVGKEGTQLVLSPSVARFGTQLLRIALTFAGERLMPEVIDCAIRTERLKPNISHGEHFLSCFGESIYEYLLQGIPGSLGSLLAIMVESNCLLIVKVLCKLLDFGYQHRRDRQQLAQFVDYLLEKWKSILAMSQELDNSYSSCDLQLLEFMSHIAMACPFPLHQIGPKAAGFELWLLGLISATNASLDLKSKAIFLLPTLVGGDGVEHAAMTAALEKLQLQHFPLRSAEFLPNTPERISFLNTLNSLLDATVVSKSLVLLLAVIQVTASDAEHIAEAQIRVAMEKFMRAQNSQQQVNSLKLMLGKFLDEQIEPTIRMTILKRYLISGLRYCSFETILAFYKLHIVKIMALVGHAYGTAGSGWDVEHALVNRIGGFQLIEQYVAILPREMLLTDDCLVTQALFNDPGNVRGQRLLTEFSKKAHAARKEVFLTGDRSTTELFRRYQCSAYRALAASISNTKDDIRMYDVFLFRENDDKGEYIWRKLIDCSDDQLYEDCSQELEEAPRLKEKLVSIRRITFNERDTARSRFTSIAESSLSLDVEGVDLNHSIVRTVQQVAQREADELTSRHHRKTAVTLERSKINDHEVMATVCAVIQHVHENKIVTKGGAVPALVKFLAESLRDQRQHRNVRLFLAKLIDNCRVWLKPYGATLLVPLMQVIVDECICQQLNTLVTDLVALILEWSTDYRLTSCDEISLASALVKFMMRHCYHERKEVFRLNLELLQNLVTQWSDVISVPSQLLYDMIRPGQDPVSHERIGGLQLNAIVLATSKLVPWTDTTKQDYVRAIFLCMDCYSSNVYKPAAELLGMCLGHIYPNGSHVEDEHYQSEFVGKLVAIQKVQIRKFIDLVYGIHKGFPEIIDSFRAIVAHNIPASTGAEKRICLEMLLARIEQYQAEVYRELVSLELKDLLRNRDYQLLALHLVNRSVALMSVEEIEDLLQSIAYTTTSDRAECRDVAYEILLYIFEHKGASLSETARCRLKQCLLAGMNDADPAVQNRIFEFWVDATRMPQEIDERFVHILNDLYDSSVEAEFLGYATQILLQSAIKNPESKMRVFLHEYDESDVKLREYSIETSWRQRNSLASAPLFVESQQRYYQAGDGSQMERMIRATQFANEATVEGGLFEPTQDPSQISQSRSSFVLPTQNSLLFDVRPSVLDRRSQRMEADSNVSGSTMTPGDQSFNRLRKRILKDREASRRLQAMQAIDRRSHDLARQTERRNMRENEVVLYRRYRIGDFPDLLINGLAFLLPLQALCRRDPRLARQLFVAIFTGILQSRSDGFDEDKLLQQVERAIQRILEETKAYDANVFNTLIEVCLTRPKRFDISPEAVVSIANASGMLTMGVLYLEAKITDFDFADGIAVRTQGGTPTLEAAHWLKLSEMYHALDEYDILADIFSDKLDSDPHLKDAIEMEAAGSFDQARRHYFELITTNQMRLQEQNFCYQSYYNCYVQMGMWEEVVEVIGQQLSSHDELWTDEWNQDNLLPIYFHGNTRLNLNGDIRGRNFIEILQVWMQTSERADYIRGHFGEEMTTLQIASGEHTRAKFYSEQVMRQFLEEWSFNSVLSERLRIGCLLQLRKVVEVHLFSDLLEKDTRESSLGKLIAAWNNSMPGAPDSLVLWDTLVAYRKFMLEQLSKKRPEALDVNQQLNEALFELELRLLRVAFAQNNIKYAEKVVARMGSLQNELSERGFRWKVARSKLQRIRWEKTNAVDRIVGGLCRLKTISDAPGVATYAGVQIDALNELFLYSEGVRMLEDKLTDSSRSALENILPVVGNSTEHALKAFSLKCLHDAIGVMKERSTEGTSTTAEPLSIAVTQLAESYLKLAQFCYDEYDREPDGMTVDTERQLITALLSAMQYGSKESRQLFPVLLQLPNLQNNCLSADFRTMSSLVPEWMYLQWIPQLLSHLNYDDECFLDELLLRLASTYPMALYYPAKLSLEHYHHRTTYRPFISRLHEKLRFPKLDKFLCELCKVVIPSMKVSKIVNDVRAKLDTFRSKENFLSFATELMEDGVFPEKDDVSVGKEYRKLLPYASQWKDLLELDPTNPSERENLRTGLLQLENAMKKLKPSQVGSLKLEHFSPWLAEYHSTDREEMIELPGQYDGGQPPVVIRHIRIVKVSRDIQVYRSLRLPIRISFQGSDGKDYSFLVKHGEDLRQDQRIQQLLREISNRFRYDQHCHAHLLDIRTYQVVPIRASFGMIGWLANTVSMSDVAKKAISRFNPAMAQAVVTLFEKFLLRTAGLGTEQDDPGVVERHMLYGKAVANCAPERMRLKFIELCQLFKADTLKSALYEMSVSPESFYRLRNNFAKSLAAMNVACWVLGIGDRHLSNIVIDCASGRLAGVDFGYAFGSGTRDLPVPELLPFRLTPQFLAVMEPLRLSGTLHKCHLYTLQCLRNARKLLRSCLEVFIREPTLDWLEAARRRYHRQEPTQALDWDPQTRIQFAVRKLNGAHPKVLLAEELRLGLIARNEQFLNGYMKILNVDALPQGQQCHLTVEQQTQILLQLATDGCILGVTFAGWFPWF